MNAYEIPNLRFSVPAGADVARCRFVAINENACGVASTASLKPIGVSMNQAANGQVLEVATGLVMVEAATGITAGSVVYSDAEGRATNVEGTIVAGVAMTPAVAGGVVTVKID